MLLAYLSYTYLDTICTSLGFYWIKKLDCTYFFILISILVLQHSSQIQHLSTLHVLSWRPNLFSIYIDNEVNDSKLISISAQPTRSAHDSKFINLVCSNHKLISYQPLIDQSSTKSSKLNLKSSSIVNERWDISFLTLIASLERKKRPSILIGVNWKKGVLYKYWHYQFVNLSSSL